MNWLAHLYLSEAGVEHRLGNVLADVLRGPDCPPFTAAVQRGIACHRAIDAFTDSHPLVGQSRQRIQPPYRRFAGILVDVYYDHLLARHWYRYCDQELTLTTAEAYDGFLLYPGELPERVWRLVRRMAAEDWLAAIRDVADVQAVLARVEKRMRRPFPLASALGVLQQHDLGLEQDFLGFFPDLCQYTQARQQRN
jgi:acyl carrier protein phosphodiesterase